LESKGLTGAQKARYWTVAARVAYDEPGGHVGPMRQTK